MLTRVFERVTVGEISEIGEGYVIYDEQRDRVHFLNTSAAVVLEFCDGDRSIETIARLMNEGYGADGPALQDVETCLHMLEVEQLIRRRE